MIKPEYTNAANPLPGAHQYILQAATSSTSCPSRQLSTRSEKRGSNVQTVSSGTQTENTQGQPPKKKQRKSSVQRNIATPSAATRQAQGMRKPAKRAKNPPKRKVGITRRINGKLEWYDKEDLGWKPAGYHHEYRADFIARDAQQPGAPLWTKDMGTDYTSFSPLTQGWNQDPNSIIDSQGRRVFAMEKRPADWMRSREYGTLIYNGLVMLDKSDNPVRDIPGLPLTLKNKAPAWLLAGLKRCLYMHIPDLEARLPLTREPSTGAVVQKSLACLPERIRRWHESYGFKIWGARPNAQRLKQLPQPNRDFQEYEAVSSGYLPSAEPELGLGDPNSDLFGQGPYFSPETSYERDSTHDATQPRAGAYGFDDKGSPFPSWDNSALAEHGEQADTIHIPTPQPYNSNPGLQRAPDYNDNHYGECDFSSSSGLDDECLIWNPNDHTATPYYPGRQSMTSTHHFGNQRTFAQPTNGLPSEMAYSPNFALESSMQQIESPKQSQSYVGQEQPHSILADTSIGVDTQEDFFFGVDFRHIPPRTTAEIAFVQSTLNYTRAHYKSLMLQEPPESSHLLSYAEQYSKIQQDLNENWPDVAPVNLRAI